LDPPPIGVLYLKWWYNNKMGTHHFAKTMRSPYFTKEELQPKCECNKIVCRLERFLKSFLSAKKK
jgi:hypothetical protein